MEWILSLCILSTISLSFGINVSPHVFGKEIWVTETQLKTTLLKDYEKGVIPLKTRNTPVTVDVSLSLISIDTLDFDGNFEGKFFIKMHWDDWRLQWTPSQYDNIKTTTSFLYTDIWVPDISLYNGKAELMDTITGRIQPTVTYTGSVTWLPPLEVKTQCYPHSVTLNPEWWAKWDLPYYPTTTSSAKTDRKTSHHHVPFKFDNNWVCMFKFSSWVHDESTIHLTLANTVTSGVDLSFYVPDPIWTITQNTALLTNNTYPSCSDLPYGSANFVLNWIKK